MARFKTINQMHENDYFMYKWDNGGERLIGRVYDVDASLPANCQVARGSEEAARIVEEAEKLDFYVNTQYQLGE